MVRVAQTHPPLRTCKTCGETKPLSEYNSFTKPNGLVHFRLDCKICHNAAVVKYITDRRAKDPEYRENQNKYFNELKRKQRRAAGVKPRTNISCRIIARHSKEMKHDNQRLHSTFLMGLVGVECRREK